MSFFTGLKAKLLSILAAIGLFLAIYVKGRSDSNEKHRVKKMESYIETKEVIDEVRSSPDRDSAVERLRRNGLVR